MVTQKVRTALAAVLLLGGIGAVLAAAPEHKIGQKNKEFTKKEITIKPGEKIVFENDDDVAHNVFCNNPDCKFNTKTQAPGAKSPVTFDKEGTYEVRCAIHPKMKLTVTVKK